MHEMNAEMKACIEECLRCQTTCLGMAMNHCLAVGGAHVEKEHFTTMLACAEICGTAARFMMMGSRHHPHLCRECAEICRECARSCEQVGDMQACVDACNRCAQSCESMSGGGGEHRHG